MSQAARALDRIFRAESGAVLATLIRVLGDFQLAEDAFQDALTAALEAWPKSGLPASPAAWLTTTARRKALDRLRHSRIGERKHADWALLTRLEQEGQEPPDARELTPLADDQLRLIFTCCHPALSRDARVALTLRTLGGLSVAEIARAFLVSEAALAQRLARAKQKISHAGIPYEVPDREALPARLEAALGVLYLVFNEGYLATAGRQLVRGNLVEDALRLARGLAALLPDQPESRGLLALMLLHDARREARIDAAGELVLLEEQDRSQWDQERIREGLQLIQDALAQRKPGPYQIQAAIAAVHSEAATAADTDWPQIVLLYQALLLHEPTPIVELNRAVAVSFASGPSEGLRALDEIRASDELEHYSPFHLARADLLRRLERLDQARACYHRALACSDNEQVRRFIERRLRAG
ncbi:MAG: RNA polymerase sigma factor [Deltaproteobacteria bacterium]